jgi:hypothetical protein
MSDKDVADALRAVAKSIYPDRTIPCEDATGVHVTSATEALMGITSALVGIADALNSIASAIVESNEGKVQR